MTRDRLLVADPRLRPSMPETFSSDEEYTRTFVGFMLEEIRQEASEAIEAREPISAFWVQALDEHKVSRPANISGLAFVTSVRPGCDHASAICPSLGQPSTSHLLVLSI
jgi:hypothetical protein